MGAGPKLGDPHFEAWDEEDSMIMAWLWNSMILEISDTCMFLATAKDIWNAIQQTYSKARDAAQVYEVKVKNVAAKQGDKTVTEYANQLKSLWQELDHYRILGKQEVSCFNEVVALIQERKRRCLMLNPQNTDSSAMVAGSVNQRLKIVTTRTTYGALIVRRARHTRERCWKLHGKPPSREWGQKGEQPTTPQEIGGHNQEEVERVRSLIYNLDKPANLGSLAYSVSATDHMTHSPNIFSTYFPCSSSRKIATADGSLTTVAGIGDVKISPSLMLKNVLHVPRLTMNLISIQKLTQDLHCNVVFYHSHCVFQDEDSGRMIGHARERDGLYYLKAPISNKSSIPFYLIHSDIWGPSPIPNITGAKWFGKLDPRALKCVFLGYSSTQKGYKCYHPPSKRFYVSIDGENSVMEDKDRGEFLFLDLPSLPLSKQSRPTDPLIETLPKLPDQLNTYLTKCFRGRRQVQSEIEESSLESMAKDVRTGHPDTPSEARKRVVAPHVLLGNPDGVALFSPPDVSHPNSLRHFTGCLTSKFFSTTFHGCLTSGILLRRHSTGIFHIRHLPDAEWERRAFQLPRSNIFGSADSAYPESFAAIFCTMPRCSPEASRYLRPTF
ncbi:hypothetical protein AAG906_003826 [Vitis piasezkii]